MLQPAETYDTNEDDILEEEDMTEDFKQMNSQQKIKVTKINDIATRASKRSSVLKLLPGVAQNKASRRNYKKSEVDQQSQNPTKVTTKMGNEEYEIDLQQLHNLPLFGTGLNYDKEEDDEELQQPENRQSTVTITNKFEMLQKTLTSGGDVFDKIEIKQCSLEKDTMFSRERKQTALALLQVLKLRDKYMIIQEFQYPQILDFVEISDKGEPFVNWLLNDKKLVIPGKMENSELIEQDGVYIVMQNGSPLNQTKKIASMLEFIDDLLKLMDVVNNKVYKTVCNDRVQYLQQKFQMHSLINYEKETLEQQAIGNRDFYSTLKVDTHVHHSAAMSAKHLLDFIIQKITNEAKTEVIKDKKSNKMLTLQEVCDMNNIKKKTLNLNNLNVQADKTIYQRFDKFNQKYNPLGQPALRDIFLKTDNIIQGRFLAELTKEVIELLQNAKYVIEEWRISIYGRAEDEWKKLAHWIFQYNLISPNIRWMIQIPRIYSFYSEQKMVTCFQDMMTNFFKPLFEITLNPSLNPELYKFLMQVSGFDTVDDESVNEYFLLQDLKTTPREWKKSQNPHYAYWLYYLYANITSLNILRKQRGLNAFQFRPHCGESGNIDHLAAAFLVADGINHGIMLNESSVLFYMYYLKQIGVAISPQSNNKLFLKYALNPFMKLFSVGINLSLSTDDPLILHLTNQPLLEEYAIASSVWDLSSVDMAEIARNSVIQSGLDEDIKDFWAGKYTKLAPEANNPLNSNLPQSRFLYRLETLKEELSFILKYDDNNKQTEIKADIKKPEVKKIK